MISADALKTKLKMQSKQADTLFQDMLMTYGLERTLYRISISNYNRYFTLKGGILLYALFDGDFSRATTDIDLLANFIDHDIEHMEKVFREILSMKVDDALAYDLEQRFQVKRITEFKEYHGVNISTMAYLDRTRIPISIDIGFNDIIYPERVIMDFPVLLNEEVPKIYAYSLPSVIAEKFEAIVSLGYLNSRFKDFYDLYVLSKTFSFSGDDVINAMKETFTHRGTAFDKIVAFQDDFVEDHMRLVRWQSFAKKKKAMMNVSLKDTIVQMKCFLLPVVHAIQTESSFDLEWKPEKSMWI